MSDEIEKKEQEWTTEDAERTYFVKSWGDGYFDINEEGNLSVSPDGEGQKKHIDIYKVVQEMKVQGIKFPAVIRFQDVVRSQVRTLCRTFRATIEQANYEGRYLGVYPVKVNQMREVVEEIVDAGAPFDFGLEAGSKAELLSVLALNSNERSITILNGYKDEDYMRLALIGIKLGRKMIVVIEKFTEIGKLLTIAKEMNVEPLIGLRSKMSIKGRGKWAGSTGDRAKFGLTTSEIIMAVELLKEHNLSHCLKLFHFHVGSQIVDIRAVKEAINEGARLYTKLYQMGINLEYFDVGGGLGIDYDGSKSTNESSRNYSLSEYTSDVVYGLKEICDLENVPHPNIISESGRFITAHHSCVITNVIGVVEPALSDFNTKKVTGEHHFVQNMRELSEELKDDNFQEVNNEAIALKENALDAFRFGILSLEERAKIETLFWRISHRIFATLKDKDFIPDELYDLKDQIAPQYLCNFSVFQSAADSWAIDQLLPIVPIHKLNQKPERLATIVDITCDSDGKIDNFIDRDEGISKTLSLHAIKPGEEYYVGIFLTGAYQDVMGDMHNLYGRLNEVHVYNDDEDPENFYIEEVITGNSAADVLKMMQYNPEYMALQVKKAIDRRVSQGKIVAREGVKLVDFYEDCLVGYTYLKS